MDRGRGACADRHDRRDARVRLDGARLRGDHGRQRGVASAAPCTGHPPTGRGRGQPPSLRRAPCRLCVGARPRTRRRQRRGGLPARRNRARRREPWRGRRGPRAGNGRALSRGARIHGAHADRGRQGPDQSCPRSLRPALPRGLTGRPGGEANRPDDPAVPSARRGARAADQDAGRRLLRHRPGPVPRTAGALQGRRRRG